MVTISLAAAITAALAIAWRRQRRRRIPTWPPDAQPAESLPVGPTTEYLVRFAHRYTAAARDDETEDYQAALPLRLDRPIDPRSPTPARVVLAERDGRELAVDLAGFGAVTIRGPLATDAARAAMVALLAAGRPADTEVLLAGRGLLAEISEFPGLRRAADLAEALGMLEAELVHRTRLLELYEQPDFPSYRQACPDDPLPALLLVADQPPPGEVERLLAIIEQGRRLGVGALLTGAGTAQTAGAGIVLDQAGRVQVARPPTLGDGQLVGARMLTLDAAQAADLLATLAAARLDREPTTADATSRAMQTGTASEHAPAVTATRMPPQDPGEPGERPVSEVSHAAPSGAGPAVAASATMAASPTGSAATADPATMPTAAARPAAAEALVTVRLLGPYEVRAGGGLVGPGLRSRARELLAYLLVHPQGATIEQAVEALWPETPAGKERERFWNALGNLRSVLRKATGQPNKAIAPTSGRYQPEPGMFIVDLWRFRQAVDAARRAGDGEALAAALAEAADAYGGTLLDSEPYGWAEPARQALRDRAVAALSRLAELREEAGDDQGALAALEQTIEADPVAEECYRRLMRLHARRGRLDLAERTYRQLQDHLDELGVDLDPETQRLLVALRHDARSNPSMGSGDMRA